MFIIHCSLFYRILNLFSRDIYVLDQILARVIHGLCRTLASCLSIVVVIGYSFPLFLISVIPLGWFYLRVMRCVTLLLVYKLYLNIPQILSGNISRTQTDRCSHTISDLCLVLGDPGRTINHSRFWSTTHLSCWEREADRS